MAVLVVLDGEAVGDVLGRKIDSNEVILRDVNFRPVVPGDGEAVPARGDVEVPPRLGDEHDAGRHDGRQTRGHYRERPRRTKQPTRHIHGGLL